MTLLAPNGLSRGTVSARADVIVGVDPPGAPAGGGIPCVVCFGIKLPGLTEKVWEGGGRNVHHALGSPLLVFFRPALAWLLSDCLRLRLFPSHQFLPSLANTLFVAKVTPETKDKIAAFPAL